MGLLDIFGDNKNTKVTKPTNSKDDTLDLKTIAMIGLPIILMAMKERNKDPKKAEDLTNTLDRHEKEPSGNIFDQLNRADKKDGDKIMDHVLGDKKNDVIDQIAEKAGVSRAQAQEVLQQISPSVLEQIANDTKGDRSVETVRESTDKQLKEYENHSGTLDLKDLADKFLGSGNITSGLKDLLGGFLK